MWTQLTLSSLLKPSLPFAPSLPSPRFLLIPLALIFSLGFYYSTLSSSFSSVPSCWVISYTFLAFIDIQMLTTPKEPKQLPRHLYVPLPLAHLLRDLSAVPSNSMQKLSHPTLPKKSFLFRFLFQFTFSCPRNLDIMLALSNLSFNKSSPVCLTS